MSKVILITGNERDKVAKAFLDHGISMARVRPTTHLIRFIEKVTGRHLRTSVELDPPVVLSTKDLRQLKWYLLERQNEEGLVYRVDALTNDLEDVEFHTTTKLYEELSNAIRALHPQALVELMLTKDNLDAIHKGYAQRLLFIDGDFTEAEYQFLHGLNPLVINSDELQKDLTKEYLSALIGEPIASTEEDKPTKKGKK